MAYAPNPEDQNAPQQLTGQPMNQVSTSSGAGANSSSVGGPQGSTAVPATTQAPPVQNLQAYLSANAPQAVQMGQNISNNLNQTAGKVTGDINAAQTDINGQIQQSNVAPNQDLINRAATDPYAFTQNANDVTAFQQQRDANYTGPTSFESTPYSQTLTNEVTHAQQQAPDLNKQGAYTQLARGQEKNPTAGMSNLDALLLQENPDAVASIQQAMPQFANLSTQLTGAQNSTDAAIQKAIQNDQAAKAGVQDRFLTGQNAVVPEFQNGLNTKLQGAVTDVNNYNTGTNTLTDLLNRANPKVADFENSVKNYNDALKNDIGITTAQNQTNNPFVNSPVLSLGGQGNVPNTIAQPTLSQVANQQDLQKEQALEKLLGDSFTPQFDNLSGSPYRSPGSVPTIQDILNPELASIQGQLGSLNPNVQTTAGTKMADPVRKAYQSLLDYLQETNPTVNYGSNNGVVTTGQGTTYVDPATGQTRTAY